MMRTCRKCGETKPLEQFVKASRCYHGRSHQCKACSAAVAARWRDDHPERTAENNRKWAEHSVRTRRQAKEARAAARAARLPHETDCSLSRVATALRKNSRSRGAEIVDRVVPLVVLERDDGLCGICGEDVDPMDFDIDHVVAIADGGEHSYENVQLAHSSCNSRKSAVERSARVAV
jgi:5-methylcytosine-specific restriction endonuclease McrA